MAGCGALSSGSMLPAGHHRSSCSTPACPLPLSQRPAEQGEHAAAAGDAAGGISAAGAAAGAQRAQRQQQQHSGQRALGCGGGAAECAGRARGGAAAAGQQLITLRCGASLSVRAALSWHVVGQLVSWSLERSEAVSVRRSITQRPCMPRHPTLPQGPSLPGGSPTKRPSKLFGSLRRKSRSQSPTKEPRQRRERSPSRWSRRGDGSSSTAASRRNSGELPAGDRWVAGWAAACAAAVVPLAAIEILAGRPCVL